MAPSLWRFLRPPHRDEGQALALFAGGLVIFLGFVAMSIDVGRFVWARTQMQAAVDAAALAAAQSMPSTADATQQATDYWMDNSGFIRAQATDIQFSVTFPPGNKKVLVTGEASLPTWFARFLGFNRWNVTAEGEAEAQVVDAVVVLDRSGSMCWDSHGPNGNYVSQVRLKRAISSSATTIEVTKNDPSRPLSSYVYVGQVFRLESSASSEWLEIVAINEPNTLEVRRAVPSPVNGRVYRATGHSANRYIRGSSCQTAGVGPYHPWEEVKNGARIFANEMNADYDRVGYVHFSTRGRTEQALTSNLASLRTSITNTDDPTAWGGDDGRTNIAHGFYLGNKELLDNGRDNAHLVLVLLSDGVANTYCSGSNYTTACSSVGNNVSTATARTLEQADYARANGITVYTISYGNDADDSLMQEVARRTGGFFYKAPDDAALQAAFIDIARQTHIKLSR
ncbi:MAG: hypothetical protein Kow0010_25060 [Dehalococcoidia bacterium]